MTTSLSIWVDEQWPALTSRSVQQARSSVRQLVWGVNSIHPVDRSLGRPRKALREGTFADGWTIKIDLNVCVTHRCGSLVRHRVGTHLSGLIRIWRRRPKLSDRLAYPGAQLDRFSR